MTKRRLLHMALALCIFILTLFFLQRLLSPKYVTAIVEGSLIEEYYYEDGPHDVVFIGDCEVYENISPITLWENYGFTSYIRGSAQQLIWQSYYLMKETLRYEKPKVMVFNVLSMKYDTPQSEAYNRMTLDGMKMSKDKLGAVKASMTEEEHLIEYIFPLLRYHSRWSELKGEDFKYMFKKEKISHNGYYMRVDTLPAKTFPQPRKLASYEFSDITYHYLDLMVKLCRENGVELMLMKAPSLYPHWYDEWDQQMVEYAKEHNLKYINFIELIDEMGIDFDTDTHDAGLHLNLAGAEKLSMHLGEILKSNYNLVDRRADRALSDIWARKKEIYDNMRESQYRELEEYGYLKSLGVEKRD